MSWGIAMAIFGAALGIGAMLLNHLVRMRHGHPPENGSGSNNMFNNMGANHPDDRRKIELLSHENEQLTGKVSRLEERIAVLERIATDKESTAMRLADEIEKLRN